MKIREKTNTILAKIAYLGENDINLASRQFFSLLYELLTTHSPLADQVLRETLNRRFNITDEHLAWLMFAAAQYLSNYQFDKLDNMLPNAARRDAVNSLHMLFIRYQTEIVDICSSRNICTNIPNRYAALQIIGSLIKRQDALKVLDIGCSLGLGLLALNTSIIAEVRAGDLLLRRGLTSNVKFDLIGIDVMNPDIDWLKACYLPEYKEERSRVFDLYWSLKKQHRDFKFLQGNALDLITLGFPPASFDIVWTSNTCYQVEGNTEPIEEAIRWLLKDNGFWIYSYYRDQQPAKKFYQNRPHNGSNPYVACVYPKLEWSSAMEVLQASDDDVHVIERGVDFDRFFCFYTER